MLCTGGIKQQQAARAILEASPPQAPSKLAERLMLLVGWGLISANTARWICEGAMQDGPQHNDVDRMAKCGASGKYV